MVNVADRWREGTCIFRKRNTVTAFVQEVRSKKGYDLQMQNIEVLSRSENHSPIVINNKCVEASIEKLLDFRSITLKNEKERAIFKIQEGMVFSVKAIVPILSVNHWVNNYK